jgi:hypothetical protein
MANALLLRPFCVLLGLAAILGPAATALAQEFQPYPAPRITTEQYARYAEQVRQAWESTADIQKGENVIVFSDLGTRTFWVFTTKNHPAHPAWVTRQMVEEDGQVRVRQIGFFAGDEEAFAKLFREYQERNEQLVEDVQRRNR